MSEQTTEITTQESTRELRPQEDRIITTVSIGEMSGGNLLSREEFLDQYPANWQELLRTGMSKYIRSDGITLSRKDGLRQMKVFAMCRNVRQRVAERMATRLTQVTPPRPAGLSEANRRLLELKASSLAEQYQLPVRGNWPAA